MSLWLASVASRNAAPRAQHVESSHKNWRFAHRLALLGLVALFALLQWKFAWSCDDSFISFRYARNFARGAGLLYNLGEAPPVEGYTNFLWVLFLTPFEALGADVPLVAKWTSALCGCALVLLVARVLTTRFGASRATWCALIAFASLPPLAVWSTSGLETMPFALALFGAFAALHAPRPKTALAACAAALAVLLRADGFVAVTFVLAASAAGAGLREDRAALRAIALAAATVVVVLVGHLLWRHSYYGAWQPNTARVKVEFGALAFERGLRYVATFVVSFPALLIMLALASPGARAPRDPFGLTALAVVVGVCAYVIAIGGDFMAMGRFLVPALPFAALAFAAGLARLGAQRAWLGFAATGACVALSLPVAFGVEIAPQALRERLAYRWSADVVRSEYEQWRLMSLQVQRWVYVGRALRLRTQPGESLMQGTIGAIGYYSELVIHDPFGLVNRDEFAASSAAERASPGHQRRVPFATILAKQPTYLDAAIVPRERRDLGLRDALKPGGELFDVARPEYVEIADVPGLSAAQVLRLVRYVPRKR